jgi:hypothetical protein
MFLVAPCRYPLTGECYELKVHEGPVARLRVSYDDCLLACCGEDGSLMLMDIRDKELIKASTRREQVKGLQSSYLRNRRKGISKHKLLFHIKKKAGKGQGESLWVVRKGW